MDELVNMFFANWFNINEAALSDDDYQKSAGFIDSIVKDFAQRAVEYAQDRPGYMTSDQERYMQKLAELGLAITSESGFEPASGRSTVLPNTDLLTLGAARFMDRFERYKSKTFDKFDNFSDFLADRLKTSDIKNLASRLIDIVQSEGGMEKKGKEEGEADVISYDAPAGEGGKTMAGQIGGMSDTERQDKEAEQAAAGEEREVAEGFFKTMVERSKACFANLAKQAEQRVAGIGSAIYNQDPARGSNLYRNAAYAMYFAKYVLNMIEQNPEKYESILKKTFSVTRSKTATAAKKVVGFEEKSLVDYEAKLKDQLYRKYGAIYRANPEADPDIKAAVDGRRLSAKAADDARAQVKAMLKKNQDDLISGRVEMPEGSAEEDFLKVATQMTIDDINTAMGKKKEAKKASMARFGQHVAGLKGIHTALQVMPSGKAEAESELMSEFARAMRSEVAKDQELLKVLAIRAFLGLAGLAPGTKGCMSIAEALEHMPAVFRNEIRTRVNLVKDTRVAAPASDEGDEEEQATTPVGRSVKAGRTCDQILTLRGTSDQEKINSLVDKFFDFDFPSKEFKTVAQTNIVEKAIFGTIIASLNATLSDDKTCDHPSFQFPFRGRHYDIYTQKAGKNESYGHDEIFDNLRFKYEMNRLVKEIIHDLS